MHAKENTATFNKALEQLKGQNVAVLGHTRPDGDCIGSQVALTRCLNALGITATAVNADNVPDNLTAFLADTPFIRADQLESSDFTPVHVDCGDDLRVGKQLRETFPNVLLNIDHHLTNNSYAKFNIIDSDASATAEILAEIFLSQNLPLDQVTAQALYVGIAMDTGQFCFPSTNHKVLALAAQLVEKGANPSLAAHHLYDSDPIEKLRLLEKFLGTLKLELEGQLCIGFLSKPYYEETGTKSEHADGFVNYTRSIKSVQIGALLEEIDGGLKGSLRAKDPKIRVDMLAQKLGGGGHACAAGFRTTESLNTFYPKFIKTVEQHLKDI